MGVSLLGILGFVYGHVSVTGCLVYLFFCVVPRPLHKPNPVAIFDLLPRRKEVYCCTFLFFFPAPRNNDKSRRRWLIALRHRVCGSAGEQSTLEDDEFDAGGCADDLVRPYDGSVGGTIKDPN